MLRTSLLSRPRQGLAAVAAGAIVVAGIVLASPASATSPSCTFTDGAQSASSTSLAPFLTGVHVGDVVTISCSGLAAHEALAVAEASGAAGLPGAVSTDFTNIANVNISASADASGNYTGTYTLNTFTASNSSACPPTQAQADAGISCSLAVADLVGQFNLGAVELAFAGAPTPSAASLTTDKSTYGAGATVTLSGTNFWGDPISGTPAGPIPAPTLLLDGAPLANALTTSGAAWPDSTTNSLSQGGVLGGAVTVTLPDTIANGPHALTVIQANATPYAGNGPSDSVTASAIFSVSGPSISLSKSSGQNGDVIHVTGTNWLPDGGAPTVKMTTGDSNVTNETFNSTAGSFSADVTLDSSDINGGSNPIVATQGALTASAAFAASSVPTLHQDISQVVHPGTLTDSQVGGDHSAVVMSAITLNGTTQVTTGSLNNVTVIDARGTFGGWTLNGQLEGNFTDSLDTTGHGVIPAANLSWTPNIALAATGSGVLSEVNAGAAAPLSASSAVNLASAGSGGGGGQFVAGAGLTLSVPPTVAAGTYVDTLDITLA